MRAVYLTQTGSADVLQVGELPTPVPGPGEVLVRVAASAINPIDLYVRSGLVKMSLPMPFIPHADLAGTVVKLGPGVSRFKEGDRVWGSNQGLLGRQGTCAEFAAVHEDWLYPLPPAVAEPAAAAVALTGITAHLGLFRAAELKEGETVFVHGGTGGVGSLVVQMAKAVNARVITTVGTAEKAALCRSRGADLVLNYKQDSIGEGIRTFTNNQGVDIWFETQREPNLEEMISLMRMRGRIIIIAGRAARPPLPFGAFYPRDLSIHGFAMFNASPLEQRYCALDINRWLAKGLLKPLVGRTFPLEQAAAAHQYLEENTLRGAGTLTGKVVITMGESKEPRAK
jgi:NADPH2:quinone reductase